jgi:hypothetical protein
MPTGPDLDAFTGGLELGLLVVLLTAAFFAGLAIVRRITGV